MPGWLACASHRSTCPPDRRLTHWRAAHWAVAFALTQVVEVPIYLRALRGHHAHYSHRVLIAFGASAWTHPIAALVIPAVWSHFLPAVEYAPGETPLTMSLVLRAAALAAFVEGFAITGEAAYLAHFRVRRALLWSAIANGASFSVGVVLTLLTGWP